MNWLIKENFTHPERVSDTSKEFMHLYIIDTLYDVKEDIIKPIYNGVRETDDLAHLKLGIKLITAINTL